jgi:hypothetical protein
MRLSASVRLAPTMRCATLPSDNRKARAISPVVRPPMGRSVSATARCLAAAVSQAPGLSGILGRRPLLEGGDEGVLGKLLGEANIAHQARDASNQPRLLDPEDRVDGVMDVGGCQGPRSQHHGSVGASKSVGSAEPNPLGAGSSARPCCVSSAGASRPLGWPPLG